VRTSRWELDWTLNGCTTEGFSALSLGPGAAKDEVARIVWRGFKSTTADIGLIHTRHVAHGEWFTRAG